MNRMKWCATAFVALIPVSLVAQQPIPKAPKATASPAAIRPEAISGLASSGRNCIGPSGSNIHPIGWAPSNSRVTISFSSDFDPVAAATIVQLGGEAPDSLARSSFWANDDGGGNLEPLLNFTTTYSGTLSLAVSKYSADRASGCYFYKVEIVTG